MAQSDRSSSRLPMIAGGGLVILAVVLGGGFLRLGMNAVPPEQTQVHKDIPASTFATTSAAPAVLPAMPPVPAAPVPGVAQPVSAPVATVPATQAPVASTVPASAPAASSAPVLTPSTPLPTCQPPSLHRLRARQWRLHRLRQHTEGYCLPDDRGHGSSRRGISGNAGGGAWCGPENPAGLRI